MDRIGNQRQRVGGIAERQFGHDKRTIERNAGGESKAEIVRRVAVPGMAVRVVVMIV